MADALSREDISKLRRELETLKSNADPQTLTDAITQLADVFERFLSLLESANKEILDEHEQGIGESSEKLNTLIEQNEKIARGIVALADIVKRQELLTQFPQYPQTQPAQIPNTNMPLQQPTLPDLNALPPMPPNSMQFNNQNPQYPPPNNPYIQVTSAPMFTPTNQGVQEQNTQQTMPQQLSPQQFTQSAQPTLPPLPTVPSLPQPPPPPIIEPMQTAQERRKSLIERFSFK